MPNQNVETVRRAYDAYREGKWEVAVDAYVDPEVVWETRWPGLPSRFHGREGVKEWTERVMEPMELELEIVDLRSLDEEKVLAELRVTGRGRGSGVPTEMRVFDLYSIRNGKIYRRQTFYTETEALEAAGVS